MAQIERERGVILEVGNQRSEVSERSREHGARSMEKLEVGCRKSDVRSIDDTD